MPSRRLLPQYKQRPRRDVSPTDSTRRLCTLRWLLCNHSCSQDGNRWLRRKSPINMHDISLAKYCAHTTSKSNQVCQPIGKQHAFSLVPLHERRCIVMTFSQVDRQSDSCGAARRRKNEMMLAKLKQDATVSPLPSTLDMNGQTTADREN